MAENTDRLGLADNLLLQIQNLANGNQATKDNVKKISSEIFPSNTALFVFWKFYGSYEDTTVKGNANAPIHFGSDEYAFKKHTNELINLAKFDKDTRAEFITNLKKLDGDGIQFADNTQNLGSFKEFAYSYNCSNCGGSGKHRCGNCGGSGRNRCYECGGSGNVTATRSVYRNGEYVSETYYTNCYSCGGSGYKGCYSCGGSGRVTCDTCSGYGKFTDIRTVSIKAKPNVGVKTSSNKYSLEFDRFAETAKCSFLSEKIKFELSDFKNHDDDCELFIYNGDNVFTELNYQIFDKKYLGVGFSNPPFAFIKSKFFDDLFADEIKYLEKIGSDGKITTKEAYSFFNKYAGQPALDKSIKMIASIRKDKDEELSYAVTQSCDGYISNESAFHLSSMIKGILDKICPVYSWFIWFLGTLIFTIFSFIVAEQNFEHNFNSPFSAIFNIIVIFFIIAMIFGAILYIISSLVTLLKRRKIPKEYRQKMRNKEPFRKMIIYGVISAILGGLFGFFATKNLNLRLENMVNKFISNSNVCDKLNSLNIKIKSCHNLSPNNNYLQQYNKQISKTEKIKFIQKTLVQNGYKISIDGKFGKQTLLASKKYLGKNLQTVDEIYDEMIKK